MATTNTHYVTRRGYTLNADHDARRVALLPLAECGPSYSRAAADGLNRLAYAWDVIDAEAALCEGERRTIAETKVRLGALKA